VEKISAISIVHRQVSGLNAHLVKARGNALGFLLRYKQERCSSGNKGFTMIRPLAENFIPGKPMAFKSMERREMTCPMSMDRYIVWIDGFLIGGPTQEDTSADICLMANLSRRHALLLRNGEDWFIHPYHSTVVSGRVITGPALLKTGDEICLGERVRLGFRIPSVLAGSALIDFESHHRPVQSVNGIILMTDTVLLGPRKDHHIYCSGWSDLVVIYHQDGVLRCRSEAAFSVNGERVRDSAVLKSGAVVSGEDFRFRIEEVRA
jgi:hypothetical protein